VERYERAGILVFVQIDHLSGELIGEALEQMLANGAANVQLLPSLTKKGRPGQLLLIDVPRDKLSGIEEILITELGVGGWHCLHTQHVHFGTETVIMKLTFQTPNGPLHMKAKGKRSKDNEGGMVRPEHSCCVSVCQELRDKCDLEIPLNRVVQLLAQALNGDRNCEIDLRPTKEIHSVRRKKQQIVRKP